MRRVLVFGVILGLPVVAGCATAQMRGETAYRQGRYEEAVGHFQDVLSEHPQRLDALLGLGVAQYKLARFDEATDALTRALQRDPRNGLAELYLGLSYVRKREDGPAEEHLTALRELKPHPRIAAQVDRALKLMRGDPLSAEMRDFIAASLEDEAEWARDLSEVRRAAELRTRAPARRGLPLIFRR